MYNTRKIFADRLKETRKAKGFTIASLARATYIVDSTVWGYENEVSTPSLEIAAQIATTLGVSLDYLAGLDGNNGVEGQK